MTLTTFAYLFAGILLNAAAQLLLKAGTIKLGTVSLSPDTLIHTLWQLGTNLPIVGGLGLYCISVLTWIAGLSRIDVSVAYPLLSLGYVVNAVAAYFLFGEIISWQRALGIGIILIGVYVLARSS